MKVLVTPQSFYHTPEPAALLKNAGIEIVDNPFHRPLAAAEMINLIQEAGGIDAMIAGLDEITGEVLAAAAPRMKLLSKYGVGYNNVDLAAAKAHNLLITTTRGANAKSVAELTFGLMLDCVRHISRMDEVVKVGEWTRFPGVELSGKTLGIIGLGNIGSEVAKRAAAFEMAIIAHDIVERPEVSKAYNVTYVTLDEIITRSDILTLHAPATPLTIGMINAERLQAMKPSACLINTARGDLVVENDLYNALTQGWIAGAGVDVLLHEPPLDTKLVGLENLIVTPHAGANTVDAIRNMGTMSAEEVVRLSTGKQPKHPLAY